MAWVMKRDWTDTDFQSGEEANMEQLRQFEEAFLGTVRAACHGILGEEAAAAAPAHISAEGGATGSADGLLASALDPVIALAGQPPEHVRAAVLDDPSVLGCALDIAGAYLKNYQVDKAAAVLETVLPVCRARGGLWVLKALNQLSTVRMKQSRPEEALRCLKEVEAAVNLSLRAGEHDEAWEFWEIVYRNLGWVHSSLGNSDEAIRYIERAVEVKERVGRTISWFDFWDLGRLKATSALKQAKADVIEASRAVVEKALRLHRLEEPKDLVMRAKIVHSVGECSFALGHLADRAALGARAAEEHPNGPSKVDEAIRHYKRALVSFQESHELMKETEGKHNPLTGCEAQALSWTMLHLGQDEAAKPYLLAALESASLQQSGWGDGEGQAPALAQAVQVVDRVMEAHRRTGDREGLQSYFVAIERLCASVSNRLQVSKERIDAAIYEKLISTCSLVFVASNTPEGVLKSQEMLRKYLWDSPKNPQAQLCSQLLRSVQNAGTTAGPGGGEANNLEMAMLLNAMAKS